MTELTAIDGITVRLVHNYKLVLWVNYNKLTSNAFGPEGSGR
jgi:hypothetical protein